MKNELEFACQGKKCILTDFFDTLVHRRLSEENVKQYWAKRVSGYLKGSVSPQTVYELRKKSAKNVAKRSDKEEIAYSDIISELYIMLHNRIDISKYMFLDVCTRLELSCELEALYIDRDMVQFFKEQHTIGKKIIVVSDYYLSREDLIYMIRQLKIEDIIDGVFVSSEYGLKKKTGNLYKIVIKELGSSEQFVMIGDNRISDYVSARAQGIDAIHIKWKDYPAELSIKKELNRIFKTGIKEVFSNYAFAYYLYIEQIYNRVIEIRPRKVFFLAREGFFLRQLFEEFQEYKDQKVETEYLYVSRKSTLLASLKGKEETEYRSIFRSYKNLDVVSFLKNLSYTDDEINTVIGNLQFDCEKVIYDFKDSREFQELLDDNSFKGILEIKCNKEKEAFRDYITQRGIQTGDDIILVDVGWKGTIQDNIYMALDRQYPVRGLYMGYENFTGYEDYNNVKEGLIFSKYPVPSENFSVWDFETHLFEQILAAPHGSTYGYSCVNGNIVPVLEEYSAEDKELYSVSKPVQDGILRTFRSINEVLKVSCLTATGLMIDFKNYHLRASLLLNKDCIQFEKVVLTPGTNNFGWFKKIPTRSSKKEKLISMLRDLKSVKDAKLGFMSYVSYFSIKLNARQKYTWKIYLYRFVYFIEKISLKRRMDKW